MAHERCLPRPQKAFATSRGRHPSPLPKGEGTNRPNGGAEPPVAAKPGATQSRQKKFNHFFQTRIHKPCSIVAYRFSLSHR